VSDEQKQRWGNFADDDLRVDPIFDLVRTFVGEYIATDDSEGGQLNDGVVDEVLTSMDTLERDVGTLGIIMRSSVRPRNMIVEPSERGRDGT